MTGKTMTSLQKCHGFTLLEVLVAFSLLAILLTVIIQSQGETAFFIEKTRKLSLVQKEVINELLKIERNLGSASIDTGSGTFPKDHVLAGDIWQKEEVNENFMGFIPIKRITYRVSWETIKGKGEQSFEASIYGEQ